MSILLSGLQSSVLAVTPKATVPIRVVAYNVHLLPSIASHIAGKRGGSDYRAEAIGKQLARYEIIGVSEAFDRKDSKSLLKTVQASSSKQLNVALGPGRSGWHMIGSGLVLMTRWPIEQRNTLTYTDASRFLTSGFKADGFAAKGALHVRLRVGESPDAKIDCFLTHLESRSTSARTKQVVELAEFIKQHSSSKLPTILMGDLNIAADPNGTSESGTEYQSLLSTMSRTGRQFVDVGANQETGTSDAMADNGGRRIDYLLISQPLDRVETPLETSNLKHLRMLDEQVPEGSLSDHMAVACRVNFSYGKH